MTTVRRGMAVGAILALAVLLTRSPLQGDSAKDPTRKPLAGEKTDPKNSEQLLENLAAAKFSEDGVLTYETKDGALLFAMKVQPKLEVSAAKPRDYLVLVDTTASQAGPWYFIQKGLVNQLAKSLEANDRLALWTVNTKTTDLTKGFVARDAKQLEDALKQLDKDVPLGAADLKSALQKAVSSFEGRADRQAVVLYMGDGISTLNPLSQEDRVQLSRGLASRKIGFFPVPLGPQLDPHNLHSFATFTGGTALRIDIRETVQDTIKRFKETLAQPILYTDAFKLPAEVVEFMPTRMPPLRGDAPTLVLGRLSKPIAKMEYTLSGTVDGRVVKTSGSDKVLASSHDCFFLASMHDQWKDAKDVPALLRADRTLAFAFDQMKVGHGELLAQARIALAHDKLDLAHDLFNKAKEMAPNDPEAKAGAKVVEQIKSGKLKKENFVALAGIKDEIKQQPPAGQAGKREDNLLNQVEQQRLIEEQRLQLQVQETIKQAKRELNDNPDEALRRLKVMEESVRLNPDIREDLRKRLRQQLENDTRQAQQDAQRLAAARAEREQQLAAARAADEKLRQRDQRENSIRTAMSQYEALIIDGRYDEAYRQAELARQLAPDAVAATAASIRAETADNLKTILQINKEKQVNYLATMLQVERSHIPFPDEPPVQYAPASFYETKIFRNWGELSAHRKKRWGSSSFSELPSKETERLENLLNQPTDKHRAGFLKDEPLKDIIDVMKKSHNIEIRVDHASFKGDLGEDNYEAKGLTRDVPPMRGIAFGTILRDVLASMEPQATYLIRENHIEITTPRKALSEKTTRVYPVAELVFTPFPFSGMGGGLGGFGGGLGGAGGLGGGGLGGGGLGGGGLGGGGLGGGLGGGGFGGGLGGGGFGGGGLGGLGGGGFGGGGLGGLGGGGFGGGGLGGLGGGGFGGGGLGGLGGGGFGGGGLGGLGGGGLGGLGGGGLGGGGLGGGGGGFGGGGGGQGQSPFSNPQIRMLYAYQLRTLITSVIGVPDEWVPNLQAQAGGPNQPQAPAPTISIDPEWLNYHDYYDPAYALTIKGSSRVHSKTASTLKVPGAAAPAAGNFRDNGDRFANKNDKNNAGQFAKKDDGKPAKPADNKPASGKPDGGDQLASKAPAKPADLKPDVVWDQALAGRFTEPSWVISAAAMLGKYQKWDHASEFLKAALRQGVMARPWMFEAIAAAMELNHGDPDEVERAMLSTADLRPNDASGLLHAAKVMGDHKKWQRAIDFCKQSAAQNPELPQSYLQAIRFAREAKDIVTMGWAAENLLSRDYPIRGEEFHAQARRGLDDLSQTLSKEGRSAEAERLAQVAGTQQRRDLVIRLIWQGEGDLDLEVKEPIGTKCSYLHRMSPGGGTMHADLAAELHTESYVASQAFSGEYQLTVRRVWGKTAGQKATLEIIHNKGTANERVQRETLTLDASQTVTVKLENGRRTEAATVAPISALRSADRESRSEQIGTAIAQLQSLATPVVAGINGNLEAGISGGYRWGKQPERLAPVEDDVHQSAVSPWFSSGANLTTEAVVSGDRRYVRLTMNPTISHVRNGSRGPTNPLLPSRP